MSQNKILNNKIIQPSNMINKNLNKKVNSNLFTKEYEINDKKISVRNILTKGQTHDEISHYSGASISTRGRFIAPNEKNRSAIHERPLYLFIQGNSKNDVDLAIQKIEEIIQHELINSQNSNNPKLPKFLTNRNSQPTLAAVVGNDSLLIDKIIVGLDHAPESFDLRGRVIGVGGANLHYIRNETGAMATLRGNNSGFTDIYLGGYESNEPMHLYIEHTHFNGLQAAKQLAKNLIETVQQELIQFQQLNPPIPANVQISTQPTIVHSEIFQPQQQQQMNISQSSLVGPPPIVQHNGIIQQPPPQTIMQPQNIMQPNAPQTIFPIQIHHQPGNNMVIHHSGQQQINPISNLNIPPPGIHMPMKTGQLVQIQGAGSHLSQPPPNIQIQPQQQPTQILLNQAPPNYQFQYVQQTQQQNLTDQQAQQVTIQHIYQTPQQMHGIVQQSPTLPPQFDQIQVRGQQIQGTQQYITVPGTTAAFMMPPPNIIQSNQTRPIQNVIYSQPHQIHYSVPNENNVNQNMITTSATLLTNTTNSNEFSLKDDKNKIEIVNNANKNDNFLLNNKPPNKNQPPQQPPVLQTPVSLSFTQMPPPLQPPTIQHIVEHQQHNQVPVSMSQPHQIQITAANVPTSNFILNGPQWTVAPQQQPPPHPQNTNQLIHVAQHQLPPPQQHPQFRNPQDGSHHFYGDGSGFPPNQPMQIQFQQSTSCPPPPRPPIIQQINIEPLQQQQQFGPQIPPQQQGPPRFHLQQQQQQQQTRVLHQIETGPPQQHRRLTADLQQLMLMSQQENNNGNQIVDSYKINRKRKSENDGDPPPNAVPKIGMGLLINERDNQRMGGSDHPPPPPIIGPINNTTPNTTITSSRITATTNLSDEPNHGNRPEFGERNNRDFEQNLQQLIMLKEEMQCDLKSSMNKDTFYGGRPIHVPGGGIRQSPSPPQFNSQQHSNKNGANNNFTNNNSNSNNNNNNNNHNNHKDLNFKRNFNNNHGGKKINVPPFRMAGPSQMQPHAPTYRNQLPRLMDDNRRYNIEMLSPQMYNHSNRGNGPTRNIGGVPRYRGAIWERQ